MRDKDLTPSWKCTILKADTDIGKHCNSIPKERSISLCYFCWTSTLDFLKLKASVRSLQRKQLPFFKEANYISQNFKIYSWLMAIEPKRFNMFGLDQNQWHKYKYMPLLTEK